MHDYDDVRFMCVARVSETFIAADHVRSYDAPTCPEDLLQDAEANTEYRTETKDGSCSVVEYTFLLVAHGHSRAD